ncbi:MAG: hypothetical protein KatS3mg057_0858 [Herpetosiphonaceae bacterium]|nr:MAG: hypothetical protein KatS3mg057_0858 [Herpetosiphonaceae bacterium]
MKIFMGLMEIAGYYTNLQKGFAAHGVESVFVDISGHPFHYQQSCTTNPLIRAVEYLGKKKQASKPYFLLKLWWRGLQSLAMIPLFVWAVKQFDVFIFGYASSFFFFLDIPILKLLNKRVIYVFHGSDSRPPYIDGSYMPQAFNWSTETYIRITRKKKRMLEVIERYADIIISHPPSSQLHEKPFVPYLLVGIPFPMRKPSTPRFSSSGTIRILHSPSNPEAKGTPIIRCAIKSLRDKGYPIEFVEISGMPNAVVLAELERCDFVIDQLYSDTPMAHFATEAAFFGKPAVIGSYAQEDLFGAAEYIPPSYRCHPDQLVEAIEKLIVDEEYRYTLGQQAKAYVEANWTAEKVAQRYLQMIEADIPHHWLYNPRDIRYIYGCCISKEVVQQIVRSMIKVGGKETLQLRDKPELEQLFIDFACMEHA